MSPCRPGDRGKKAALPLQPFLSPARRCSTAQWAPTRKSGASGMGSSQGSLWRSFTARLHAPPRGPRAQSSEQPASLLVHPEPSPRRVNPQCLGTDPRGSGLWGSAKGGTETVSPSEEGLRGLMVPTQSPRSPPLSP